MPKKAARPWQGTTLGVLASIEVALDIILALFILIKGPALLDLIVPALADIQAQIPNFDPAIITPQFINYIGIAFLVGGLISFLFARALFKGQRWVTIVLTTIYAISGIMITWDLFASGAAAQGSDFISLILIAFLFWLSLSSAKDPFYAKKKKAPAKKPATKRKAPAKKRK